MIRLLRELKNAFRTEAATMNARDARTRQDKTSSDESQQEAARTGGGDGGDGMWTEGGSNGDGT